MATRRVIRVAGQVRQTLASLLLLEAKDPRLAHVTITEVKMTGDLRIARVYYVPSDDTVPSEGLTEALARAQGFLRREIGQRLQLQHSPKLEFFFDEAMAHGRHMESVFQKMREDGQLGRASDEDEATET